MTAGANWTDQLAFLGDWGDDAYGAGVECLRRAKRLGGKLHIRRQSDIEAKTPFDCYHYRIIYQTFYGMRDVLGPLTLHRRTSILPFHYRRLANAERVLVEACPSSTLKRLGLPHQNYKQAQGGPLTAKRLRTRRVILDGLARHSRRCHAVGVAIILETIDNQIFELGVLQLLHGSRVNAVVVAHRELIVEMLWAVGAAAQIDARAMRQVSFDPAGSYFACIRASAGG